MRLLRTLFAPALACTAIVVGSAFLSQSVSAQTNNTDEEQEGAKLYKQLKDEREIVRSSPLYDILRPIAESITKVVQSRYPDPIHFYIVHEAQPNAFAAPGGNVYVTDSMLYFIKNTQELAGTLCHETSHLLHHDSMALMKKDDEIRARAVAATVLLGPTVGTILAATAIAQLDENHFSRDAEEAADITGSDTCAAAGYNPWGLVWLFQDYANSDLKSPPEMLSDHPNDAHRIAALKQHFQQNPQTFAKFDSDRSKSTPLDPPANEEENFLR